MILHKVIKKSKIKSKIFLMNRNFLDFFYINNMVKCIEKMASYYIIGNMISNFQQTVISLLVILSKMPIVQSHILSNKA